MGDIAMTKIKKGSLILFAITIIYLIFGSFICKDYITYVAHNNTIDYTKKYYDDLNRLLGPGWVVQGTENGYINSISDYLKVKVISWEINYQDKAGNNQTLLLSNFEDHDPYAFGYCIEKNFEKLVGEFYANHVINPIIPAVCANSEYWFQYNIHYVSGDIVSERPSERVIFDHNLPFAYVKLESCPIESPSEECAIWQDSQSSLNLYDIDYPNIFRLNPNVWYLKVWVYCMSEELSKENYVNDLAELEEKIQELLDALNAYTNNTVNADIFYCCCDTSYYTEEYYHWYIIDGKVIDTEIHSFSSERSFHSSMYWRLHDTTDESF